ncbi:hypothetical protein [Mucilaginibacter ginsenosidivorans]|uniref:Uncharacterized protein n=1 Tax=Mucilaginibacter ginsenosidivorans TaxID=398053 RepID=A0A5B8UX59_9SPHI|nr:hypothetical protein [Mucilaginibacter ginsenosidivorans]QEC62976.1 hypothetical protein FRZ54_10425 [Mucilaginibacter ginsenosidivorans]
MQKVEFVKNLEQLTIGLKSQEIVKLFEAGFKPMPNNPIYNFQLINPILFLSKSFYDQMSQYSELKNMLDVLGSATIYSEGNLANLTSILKPVPAVQVAGNEVAIKFFAFHKALLNTWVLSKNILLNELLNEPFDEALEKGVLVFQIIIEGEGLETEQYIKIFSALNDLTEVLGKIFAESEQKSELILLDSGSDTNLGLKAGIETAKSLFLVFKEVWDFIVNRKFYNVQQVNKALLDSLTVRAQIKEKVDSGVITEEEGQTYAHIVKTRTDELIVMKVLPKELAGMTNVFSNKKLISEYQDFKRIGTGNN